MADWISIGVTSGSPIGHAGYIYTGGDYELTLVNGAYDTSWSNAGIVTEGTYYTMTISQATTGISYNGTIGTYAPTGARSYYKITISSNTVFKSYNYIDSI